MKNIYIFIFFIFFLNNLFSDGFIIIHNIPQRENPFPLEIKNHFVNVDIYDLTATTNIVQTFYNPGSRSLEGTYLFPVPKGAVIKKFSMFINGKEVFAELLDAKKARKIYEDIVRAQLDPAILEYDGLDVFKVRIFPIEPNSEKKVKISYTEVLTRDFGTIEYLYPLNTEKFSSKPLKKLSINVKLKSDSEIKNIYSTSHNIDIIKKSKRDAIISYEERDTKPDTDFKLYFSTIDSKIGLSMIPYKEENEDGFFLLNISPSFEIEDKDIIEKDVTFVFDNSGSMQGKNLIQGKKALNFCVESLRDKDRFEIIRFSTEAEPFFNKLNFATQENKDKAKKFIDRIDSIGGTNIEEALKLALKNSNNSDRLHLIVFITDGKPTIGETDENKLLKIIEKENIKKTRIFTFGIGYDINTHLLDKITEITNGYRNYITLEEDIEVKISNFFIKLNSPVLTDISINFGKINVRNIYPQKISDIFKGGSISIAGRYRGSGETTIILKGFLNKKETTFKYDFIFPDISTKDQFIPSIWATRRIGYLLDYMRLHKEEKELIDEIVFLARKYGIITPYTSYLIVEDEVARANRNELSVEYQTINIYKRENQSNIIQKREMYDSEKKEKSGKKSVQQSMENQFLSEAKSFNESRAYIQSQIDNSLNQSYKNIQGRMVYQVDNYWIDSKLQSLKVKKEKKIKFASSEYFELYNNYPLISQFLALGKNIRFVFNDIVYEIYE